MASKGQKIFIWVIAVTMLVGSIGASFLVILANDNSAKEAKAQQEAYAKMQEEQKPLALPGYKAEKFNPSSVIELKKDDIKVGTGKTVGEGATVEVNYFGWLSDGTIFDSTNRKSGSSSTEFGLDQVVRGWSEGLKGMKEGGVRKLTIPAKDAYGDQESETIPANSPLMFVVELKKIK